LHKRPVNFEDRYIGYKYFICFHNTHKIARAVKTQFELEKELEDIIENGVVDGYFTFF
jgi:hypothetical protein